MQLTYPDSLFRGRTTAVARRLLGKMIVAGTGRNLTAGIIVETEAYLPESDPACHAHNGPTRRNSSMFECAGVLYVYSIHAGYCLNVVTEADGKGCAVLIRALEPVAGLDTMRRRRGKVRLIDLTSGPSKLCQALDVSTGLDGISLNCGQGVSLGIPDDLRLRKFQTMTSTRIGISRAAGLPLRFFVDRNPYVSGLKRLHSGRTDLPLVK